MNYNSTEQTVSWFYQKANEESLTLDPPFQRRPVWAPRQQSNLVESILMELPVPEIYLQQRASPDGATEHIVVDGQQRITAILEFIGSPDEPGFELQYLDAQSPWLGQTFSGLTEDQKSRFFGHRLAVRMLNDVTTAQVKDLFTRLNRYLTKLSSQELRNATYAGPFVKLAETLAEDSFWAENRIVSTMSIRRMGDIEFVSELLVGLMHGPQAKSEKELDEYYRLYEVYEDEFPEQASVRRRFTKALDVVQETFPNIKSNRWHNKTDFYSLFVAVGHLLRDHLPRAGFEGPLAAALGTFEQEIAAGLADDHAAISELASRYVRNVQKGSSDRSRRAARHQAMLEVISPQFRKKRG